MKMLTITITAGSAKGQTFFVAPNSSVMIGRDEKADIRLEHDSHISRKHAIISLSEDGVAYIIDLNSTNGTLLDKYPVKGKIPIKDGDVITIGWTRMKIMVKDQ